VPVPEPPTRRGRAVRRVAVAVAATGLLLGTSSPASAQIVPTTTTEPPVEEPTTTTTEAPVTTTTEAPATSTTVRSTATTARPATTTTVGPRDDEVADEEVVEEPADEEDVTEQTPVTARDLLVPGDGSEGARSTTTTTTAPPEVAAPDGLSEETKIWLVVAGLVAVALLIGGWTVRYWRRTRPVPDAGEPDPTTVFPSR